MGFNRYKRKTFRFALALCFAFLFPSLAQGEPSISDKETARTLMAEGREKRRRNDLSGALLAFQRADILMNVPTTGLEVARTQVQLGMLASARKMAQHVVQISKQPKEPLPFETARSEAEKIADELEKKVPSITFHLQGLESREDFSIKLNDEVVLTRDSIDRLRIDPGSYQFVVTIGFRFEKVLNVSLKEEDNILLTVNTKTQNQPTSVSNFSTISSVQYVAWKQPLPLTAFTIAGVGLVVGTTTGILAFAKASTAKQDCIQKLCPLSTHDTINSGKSMAVVSTISFAVAAVGATIGLINVLLQPTTKKKMPLKTSGGNFVPWVDFGSAGFSSTF